MNKISVIVDYYYPSTQGGGPKKSIGLLKKILEKDLKMDVFTFNKDVDGVKYNKELLLDDVNYVKTPYFNFEIFNNDIIYFNSLFSKFTLFSLLVYLILRKKNKIIVAPRGEVFEFNIITSNKLLKTIVLFSIKNFFKKIIFHVTSEHENKELLKYVGKKKTYLIKNPIDFKIPEKVNKSYDIIFVGRIVVKKGLLIFLNQLKKINKKLKILLCVIIEDNDYWNLCLNNINTQNHQFNFKFNVPNNKILDFFNKSKYAIIPSYNENHGHVIYEAIFSNCVPIVSEKCGFKNIFVKNNVSINIDTDFFEVILENINQTELNREIKLNNLQSEFSTFFDSKILQKKYKEMFK